MKNYSNYKLLFSVSGVLFLILAEVSENQEMGLVWSFMALVSMVSLLFINIKHLAKKWSRR